MERSDTSGEARDRQMKKCQWCREDTKAGSRTHILRTSGDTFYFHMECMKAWDAILQQFENGLVDLK